MPCKSKTKDGKACKAAVMRDGYCLFHHPARHIVKPAFRAGKRIGETFNPVKTYRRRRARR